MAKEPNARQHGSFRQLLSKHMVCCLVLTRHCLSVSRKQPLEIGFHFVLSNFTRIGYLAAKGVIVFLKKLNQVVVLFYAGELEEIVIK